MMSRKTGRNRLQKNHTAGSTAGRPRCVGFILKEHAPQDIFSLCGGRDLIGAHVVHVQMLFQAGDVDADGVFAVLDIAAVDFLIDLVIVDS